MFEYRQRVPNERQRYKDENGKKSSIQSILDSRHLSILGYSILLLIIMKVWIVNYVNEKPG